MGDKSSSPFTPRLVFGISLLILGISLMLQNLGVFEAEKILRFWPLIPIACGLIILNQRSPQGRLAAVALIASGTWLLLNEFGLVPWEFDDVWPALLVFFGADLIRQAFNGPGETSVAIETDSTFTSLAVWSNIDRNISSNDFRGGEAWAVMGGSTIDLRPSLIAGGQAEIFTFAMWGGVTLLVPEDWSVTSHGIPLMAAFEDQTRPPRGGSQQRLIIKGIALMGGVEIKNYHKEKDSMFSASVAYVKPDAEEPVWQAGVKIGKSKDTEP